MTWKKEEFFKRPGQDAADRADKRQNRRLLLLQAVFVFLFVFLLYRLWQIQIVDGLAYADGYELKITRTVKDNSTRGLIYDRNGEVLAYNRPVYTVTMRDDGTYATARERHLALNSMIWHVTRQLARQQEQVLHGLEIEVGPDGSYAYTAEGNALLRFLADIFGKADPTDLTVEQRNMHAEDLVGYLAGNRKFAVYGEGTQTYTNEELQEYHLPDTYTKQEVLQIAGIRYQLSLHAYEKYVPVTLARDISDETAAYIKENGDMLRGVSIGQEQERLYNGGEAFSHILGYTGEIAQDELEQLADADPDKNYTMYSVVGKAGAEKYFEKELQGINGEKQITVNNVGKVLGDSLVTRKTVRGRDIYLSVDKNLQIAVYHILEQCLAGILADKLIYAKEFDKKNIQDASQIRIPIYDVYLALVDNHVIRLRDLQSPDAGVQGQAVAEALAEKSRQVTAALQMELEEGNTVIEDLSGEMQEYILYLLDHAGILKEHAGEKSGYSIREYLMYAVGHGWITKEAAGNGEDYLTAEEWYRLLVDVITEKAAQDQGFQKLLLRRLILEDTVTGRQLCQLLYEQKVLPAKDGDREKLISGELDAFTFLKRKIEQLQITPAQLALDPCSASAVVVQPGSGNVLALVSYPGYDNNRLSGQADSAYYSQLLHDRSLPLYNRATQQLTAPGSTFKPVTVAAGLQTGVISPDTSIFCDGVFDKVTPSLKCWKHSGHGEVSDASSALQFSCNDYLCEIAYQLGTMDRTEYLDKTALRRLQEYAKLFCLDQKSGVELPEAEPHVTDAYGIPSAIGQGTHNYTTAQIARYVNILASGGDIYPLSIWKGTADETGAYQKQKKKAQGRAQLPDAVWDTIRTGMVQFAGNNAVLKDMEIPVAGKTGTAQESKTRPDHAWFVGYAPADKPQITIAVRIANGYASSNATAVGKHMFRYYLGLESMEDLLAGKAFYPADRGAE